MKYQAVLPPSVADRVRHLPPGLKRAVKEAIRAIAMDPACGESLQRELRDYRKYKVRRFRIVYRPDSAARKVRILAIGHRRTVYEEAVEQLRGR